VIQKIKIFFGFCNKVMGKVTRSFKIMNKKNSIVGVFKEVKDDKKEMVKQYIF